MIYLVAIAGVILLFGFYHRVRTLGIWFALLDAVAAAACGWIAGLSLGIGARLGMWAIPYFNGTEPNITAGGTFSVVITFSLFGIGLGVLYEMAFRRIFRHWGILFGLAVSLVTVYPLGSQGVELLSFS